MAVHFTQGRLWVGYRAKDCSDVWFELDKEATAEAEANAEEGEAVMPCYKLTSGKGGYREPMDGEVWWYPLFDVDKCESKFKKDREIMQRQYLSDVHKYLSENDTQRVKQLEKELDQPDFRRWQAMFVHAKKWKKMQMNRRATRRNKRKEIAEEAGVNDEDVEVNSDTSDSAYESEDEERMRVRKRDASRMPPPSKPASDNKRKAANINGRQGPNSKKPNLGLRQSSAGSNRRSASSSGLFVMSGGAGNRSSTPGSAYRSDDGSEDHPWDTRDPNADSVAPTTPPPTHPNSEARTGEAGNVNGDGFGDSAFPQTDNGAHDRSNSINGNRNSADPEDNEAVLDREQRRRQHESEQRDLGINGDEEIAEVIRRSLPPQERISGEQSYADADRDEGLQEGIRRSLQPDAKVSQGQEQSNGRQPDEEIKDEIRDDYI